jgi:5'(3')-deoxyribonucleotidase
MKTIYLDMDGVVADFDSFATEVIGYSVGPDTMYPKEDWMKLLNEQRLYFKLPVYPEAKSFVTEIQELSLDYNFDLKFLTAIPHGNDIPWAFSDKIYWAKKYFPGIPVWFGPYSADKQKYADPTNILIDDRESNIEEWSEAGGIAIHHIGDHANTLRRLKLILNNF